ncbi:hypothetical protein BKA70DRAFT_1312767 [Coprinopsis sp. MPI-PUGE-AT-0042]|nr:hypothetical protein BKA70DRAFT_1312767 [Coprinopsis sp. MPI-PUGE-AT-0042]
MEGPQTVPVQPATLASGPRRPRGGKGPGQRTEGQASGSAGADAAPSSDANRNANSQRGGRPPRRPPDASASQQEGSTAHPQSQPRHPRRPRKPQGDAANPAISGNVVLFTSHSVVMMEGAQVQYCWTPFHMGCIKSWQQRAARGEPEKRGDWRCPGCQAKREIRAFCYRCFCGSVPEPQACSTFNPSLLRTTVFSTSRKWVWPSLSSSLCHPGPCPPCQVTSHFKCYCPRKTVLSFRCGASKGKRDLSCGQHQCPSVCHDGDCAPCSVLDVASATAASMRRRCYVEMGKQWTALPRVSSLDRPSTLRLRGSYMRETVSSSVGLPRGLPEIAISRPCPPCMEPIIRPCRCGATTRKIPCHEAYNQDASDRDFLCDRACTALRACGRHQCHRICCPLASLASVAKKGKKRVVDTSAQAIGTERGGLHECDLVCGKTLSFPCPRGPAPCGHSRTIHGCHDDSIPCPPCVPNVRCSLEQDKVSCGTVCGKPMPCGFHLCESLCHSGDCGACTAPCGKTRKLCLPNQHPCTLPCHAPSSCPETEPCESVVQITCPCGRVKQAVQCGKRVSNAAGYQPPPIKCTTELADALGINPQDKDKDNVVYNDDLVGFARANSKFLPIVEKAFADFVKSEKKHQVLPHMTPDKRKFVHDLANEPNRSVQLIRRLDTRIPNSTLSAHLRGVWRPLGSSASTSSLAYVNVNPKPSSTSQASAGRGWTSVVRPTPGGSSVPFLAPPSATVSRTVSPKPAGSAAPPRVQPPPATASEPAVVPAVQAEPVTENWEDDL